MGNSAVKATVRMNRIKMRQFRIEQNQDLIGVYYVAQITHLYSLFLQPQMLGQINKTLHKQINQLKQQLSKNQHHSLQHLFSLLDSMQNSLQESYLTILQNADHNLTHTKNTLKKQNQHFNHIQNASQKKQCQILNQNQYLKQLLSKKQIKIKHLLKLQQKYFNPTQTKLPKSLHATGTQCELKDLKIQEILEGLKKQNISLNLKITELQQTINEKEESIDSANILIKELIKQLETNISDRETWSQSGSKRGLESSTIRLQQQFERKDLFSEVSEQMSQQSGNCGGDASGEDNSTIDGSNTTHRDFALPEWLQFGDSTPSQSQPSMDQEEEQQMWPELLVNRFRQLIGMSYEI